MSTQHENQETKNTSKTVEATKDLKQSLDKIVFNESKKQSRKRTITLTIGVLLGLGLGLLIAFNWNWIVNAHHYIIAGLIIVAILLGLIAYFLSLIHI